jgi:choline dehydrogenase
MPFSLICKLICNFDLGFRLGAYRTFAEPHSGENLRVVPYCHARRVLLEAGRATGVEVERFGRRELYTATREVILSAGKRHLAI